VTRDLTPAEAIALARTRLVTPTEAGARRGLAVDPCTNLRCRSLGFRLASDPPALRCTKCGWPTAQPR
jgi:hypothetical protein